MGSRPRYLQADQINSVHSSLPSALSSGPSPIPSLPFTLTFLFKALSPVLEWSQGGKTKLRRGGVGASRTGGCLDWWGGAVLSSPDARRRSQRARLPGESQSGRVLCLSYLSAYDREPDLCRDREMAETADPARVGSWEGDRDSAKSQRRRCRWEAENGPSPVLTPGLKRGVRGRFSPRDALRAEDIPAARGCEGVRS